MGFQLFLFPLPGHLVSGGDRSIVPMVIYALDLFDLSFELVEDSLTAFKCIVDCL